MKTREPCWYTNIAYFYVRAVRLFSESACAVKRLALTSKNQIAPVITVAVHNITTRQ